MSGKFNIRVYGILKKGSKVLISYEDIDGFKMTKLPGGGLEWGEGLVAGLIREFKEELAIEIKVLSHLYTTDFFVRSSFDDHQQIIAVYYLVSSQEDISNYKISQETKVGRENKIEFKWIEFKRLALVNFTFPADRAAMTCLLNQSDRS